MKERPILFSGPMVRAILDGTKTQTRRPMTPQPDNGDEFVRMQDGYQDGAIRAVFEDGEQVFGLRCPFGAVGDQMWVRETWCELRREHYEDPSQPRDVLCARYQSRKNGAAYRAETTPDGEEIRIGYGYVWTPSIHMPRWASRLSLEVTGVRVERVQDISEDDARAEGVEPVHRTLTAEPCMYPSECGMDSHWSWRDAFVPLWQSIYGEGDPWVWVVSFKRAEVTP